MLELNHDNLWEPPEGTTVICVPVSGEVGDNATMKRGYALQAKKKWPSIARALGYYTLKVGNRPHILTFQNEEGEIGIHGGKNIRLFYHILTFPTRRTDYLPIDDQLLTTSVRYITSLCSNPKFPALNKGNVIFPKLKDDDRDWDKLKIFIEPWLEDDRFIAITGSGMFT